jgi:hypothetical protein
MFLGIDGKELLGNMPVEYLKIKNQNNRYIIIEGEYIYQSQNEKFKDEIFEKHPYIPLVEASNYGRIKYNNKPLCQYDSGGGYLIVEIPIFISDLIYKTFTENISDQKILFHTPIKEKMIRRKEQCHSDFEFQLHPFLNIEIDKIGNVRFRYKDNVIYFEQFINEEKPYIYLPILVYRLVAESCLPNKDYCSYTQVHHINGNGFDNSIYNIMWVTDLQHKEIEYRLNYNY